MMALARSGPSQPTAGLLAWWLGELRELLPPRWRATGPKRPSLVLQLDRPFVRVHERRGRRLESVGSLLLPETGAGTASGGAAPAVEPRLRQALDRHRGAAVLVLGEADALTYLDVLPGSAESDLGKIMAHKLDLLTPWSAEQGYAAQKVMARRRDGSLEVLLAAAARPSLDRTLRQLATFGVTPVGVDVAQGQEPGRTAGIDLLRSNASAPARRGRILLVLVPMLVLLAGGALWSGWQIYQRELQLAEQARLVGELDQRLSDLPELRARIDAMRVEANFLADDRRSRPSPLLVLEALSNLLPDSVWLSEITLDGRELAISGMADDAATLIPLVEAAPEFAQVRFHAPSTRMTVRGVDGGEREVERFALRATADPAAETAP